MEEHTNCHLSERCACEGGETPTHVPFQRIFHLLKLKNMVVK